MAAVGYVSPQQIADEIERVKGKLGPEVVRLKYTVGEDTSGEPAIYFRIVLVDSAFNRDPLSEIGGRITERIRRILFDALRPNENWGLRSYFRFRRQSEQAQLHDPDWA